jgi:hypothetical protein
MDGEQGPCSRKSQRSDGEQVKIGASALTGQYPRPHVATSSAGLVFHPA